MRGLILTMPILVLLLIAIVLGNIVFNALTFKETNVYRSKLDIKVPILYQSIVDDFTLNVRGVDELKEIIRELHADLIFRAFWKRTQDPSIYKNLKYVINELRSVRNGIVIVGSVPAQTLWRIDYDFDKNEVIEYPKTWELALDPTKWGINYPKWKLQCEIAKARGAAPQTLDCEGEPRPEVLKKYFPDITNPEFQRIFLSWIKKQIDAGVDAIWIDMLFMQARIMLKLTGDENHPAVKESYKAAINIIKAIHELGRSRGKYIYVGTWKPPVIEGEESPPLDFITISISSEEVIKKDIDKERWVELIKSIRERFGNVTILAVLDWGVTDTSPLAVFSQKLSTEEQSEFILKVDKELRELGVLLVYPVHGGFIGPNAKKLAYGKYKFYDALAPEFSTYKAILKAIKEHIEEDRVDC